MNGSRLKFLLPLLWVIFLATSSVFAQRESIVSFESDITIRESGLLLVKETIEVESARRKIKRGIYRDFPTRGREFLFLGYDIPFEVISVKRDGVKEKWRSEKSLGNTRIYIGDKKVTLPPGRYRYEIIYETSRHIRFLEDHDELYWNVTGNDWEFPIGSVKATVHLPKPLPPSDLSTDVYTGPRGSKESQASAEITDRGAIFQSARVLPAGSGMTVVLSFPKGIIKAPTPQELRAQLFVGSISLIVAIVGLAIVLAWFILGWIFIGVDPAKGTITPINHPPNDLSPGAMRYIHRMGFDTRCFHSALVGIAEKGFMQIEEAEDGEFSLHRTTPPDDAKLTAEEEEILTTLLPADSKSLILRKRNHAKISKAQNQFKVALKKNYGPRNFSGNGGYFGIGLLLAILAYFGTAFAKGWEILAIAAFLFVWLSVWSLITFALCASAWTSWRDVLGGRGGLGKAIGVSFFAIPFTGFEVMGICFLFFGGGVELAVLFLAFAFILPLFYRLLKQPTGEGRELMDKIDGFKLYLKSLSGGQTMHGSPAPDMRRQRIWQAYLMALGLEKNTLEGAMNFSRDTLSENHVDSHRYWYRCRRHETSGPTAFNGALFSSAFAASVTSSSMSSRSSGGSGGGGSSGGGGGGGGGGGW